MANVVGFRVVEAAELGRFVVVGVDCRVGPCHLIDEAEFAPRRSTLAGYQGKQAGTPLRRSGLSRFCALRVALDCERALCVAEIDAGAEAAELVEDCARVGQL